jgi:hypothetical protein
MHPFDPSPGRGELRVPFRSYVTTVYFQHGTGYEALPKARAMVETR